MRIKLEDRELKTIVEEEAWKKLSGDSSIVWTKEQLIKYQNQLDWETLSDNLSVEWSNEILFHFSKKLNWENLTQTLLGYIGFRHSPAFTSIEWLEKFESCIHWDTFSQHGWDINETLVLKFTHRWNWIYLIENDGVHWTYKLYNQLKPFLADIKLETLLKSEMMRMLIKENQKQLKDQILTDNRV